MVLARYCRKCGVNLALDSQFCPSCGTAQHTADHAATHQPSQQQQEMHTGRMPAGSMLHTRYRLLHTLGQGGMGAVYIGQDTQLGDRFVAVKEMSMSRVAPQDLAYAIEQFKQEAHMLASLHHPNLPVIHDHFSEKERWYLVMSFIEGETLHAHLHAAPDNKLPVKEVIRIGIDLCNVLDYLHTHQPQIIFRDLKPLNIMITPKGQIYLIDFGIARHFKQEQSKDTAYYYSVGYAPPEQYGQSQTGPRSDIYSLGATLHQMLTGHNPSSKPFHFTALQLDPQIPSSLATLVTQMLDMSEQNRPASTMVVKAELEKALTSSTPIAPTELAQPNPVVATPLQSAQPKPIRATPLQPVQSKPNPVAIAPVRPDQPNPTTATPANSAQPTAKPVNIWAFGKKQLVTMLILAACYGIVSFIIFVFRIYDHFFSYGLFFTQESFFIYLLPTLFAALFGSWVGCGATGIGSVLAWLMDLLWFSATHNASFGEAISSFSFQNNASSNVLGIWEGALLVLMAFFVGLVLLKTKGHYNQWKNVLFTSVVGVFAIWLIFTSILVILNNSSYALQSIDLEYPWSLTTSSIYFEDFLNFITLYIIVFPLLLRISNPVAQAWNRWNISKNS